jgi:hypothetical protein
MTTATVAPASPAAWALSRHRASTKPAARLYPPRNAQAIERYRREGWLSEHDTGVVVSFVGKTAIDAPHVFVDSGRRYDWSALAGLSAFIVVTKGVDARHAMVDLYRISEIGRTPQLIDFDAKMMAWIVSADPLTLDPQRVGSLPWVNLFS